MIGAAPRPGAGPDEGGVPAPAPMAGPPEPTTNAGGPTAQQIAQFIQSQGITGDMAQQLQQALESIPATTWQDPNSNRYLNDQLTQLATTNRGWDPSNQDNPGTDPSGILRNIVAYAGRPDEQLALGHQWWSNHYDPNNYIARQNNAGNFGSSFSLNNPVAPAAIGQLAVGGFLGASGALGGASGGGGLGDITPVAGEGAGTTAVGGTGLGNAGTLGSGFGTTSDGVSTGILGTGGGAVGAGSTAVGDAAGAGGLGAGAGGATAGTGTSPSLGTIGQGLGLANILGGGGAATGGAGAGGLNYGAGAAGLLGMLGAYQKSNALGDLANKLWSVGGPSRDRYEQSMQQGFDPYASISGYKGAVDTANESLLRRLSATGGNPFGNPGGLIEAQKQVISGTALPAIQNYQNMNANTGGLSNLSGSFSNIGSAAANSAGGVANAAGGALGGLLGSDPQSQFLNFLRQYGGGQSGTPDGSGTTPDWSKLFGNSGGTGVVNTSDYLSGGGMGLA